MRALLVQSLIFLASCSSAPQATNATPDITSAPADVSPKTFEQARMFDRFLRGSLSPQENEKLLQSCERIVDENPFCSTISKPEVLQPPPRKVTKSRRWITPVRAKFTNNKLTNWYQLRYAEFNEVIKGTGHLPLRQLLVLKDAALGEANCPNNAAIAIAAHLESFLGEDYKDTLEIAKLYEKGTSCLTDPKDTENLMTRAGLFYYLNKDYPRAIESFKKVVTLENQSSARGYYWLQRAQFESGDKLASRETLDQMLKKFPFSFHTLITVMNEKGDPGEAVLKEGTSAAIKQSKNPIVTQLIEQVELLRKCGFADSAAKLLNITIAQAEAAEPEVRLYLAGLKDEQSDHLGKIALLSTVLLENPHLINRKTTELYFPKAYFPFFEKHATGLDPYLLMSIARQESAFNPRAISRANARGLLQILPSTRKRVFPRFPANLLDPEANVQVGAKYFSEVLRLLNGQVHLALAAYNAGPNKVNDWVKRYPTTEPLLFIDLIPYRETRNYVASILRNYYWYRRINAPSAEDIMVLKEYMPSINLAGTNENNDN